MNRQKDCYRVTWLIRRLFRAMAGEADRYLGQSGLTAAQRAVMEFLDGGGPMTVPDIAARYDVSRQHVQVTVNGLLDRKLVETTPNPRHRRSRLVTLNERGRETFAGICRYESALIENLFSEVGDDDLAVTRHTLEALYARLSQRNPS